MIHSFQPRFTDDKKCFNSDQIDEVNDVFQLRNTGTDGVSFKHNQGFYLQAKICNISKFRFA